MKGYFYLTFSKENSVIIIGERIRKNEIVFKGKPSFFDAMQFSDSSPPYDFNLDFQFIPLKYTSKETLHFHGPAIYQKINLIIGHHSLIIIDSENDLNPETVFNIFYHFLIKKGNRMLFLTDVPNNKILKRRKGKFLNQNDEQERKK
jgi:hypothetical protein